MIKQIGKISPIVHRCTKAVVSPNGENYRHGSSSTQCGQTISRFRLKFSYFYDLIPHHLILNSLNSRYKKYRGVNDRTSN